MKKRALPALMTLIMIFFAGCSSRTDRPIAIGTNTWPGYEPLYLAEGKGFFDPGSVELNRFGSASEVLQQFRIGKIDMATLTLDEALLLKDQDFNIKIILVMDISNGADVLIAKKEIPDLKSLKGHRIGYENTALGALMLEHILEQAGLTHADIIPLPAVYSDHEAFFNEGIVDAVVTFEPVRTKLLGAGGVQLFDSSMIPGEIIDVMVAEESFIKEHAQAIRRIFHGWGQAIRLMREQPAKSAELMAKNQAITSEEFLATLKGLTLGCIDTNKKYLTGKEPAILPVIDKVTATMQKNAFVSDQKRESKELLYEKSETLF